MDWKDISNYETYYKISKDGKILNVKTDKILKQHIRNGYYAISLRKNEKSNTKNVHRLVAQTFLKKEDNIKRTSVNHKDGNKLNNNSMNLEWCTPKENTQHALKNNLGKRNCKKVSQFTMDDKFIATFDSIKKAEETTGASNKHISTVCRGKRNSTGGFKWKYVDEVICKPKKIKGKKIKKFPNYLITKDKQIYSKSLGSFMKLKKMDSGYLVVKLSNNKKTKDFYIRKLYREYFEDTKL
jgi:hypothetical protein